MLAGAFASCKGKDKDKEEDLPGVDILNEDLSEYIEIDSKYYKGYKVEVDRGRVSDFDIENQIIKVLCKNKSKETVEGDGVISVGDVVSIFYKGYYLKGEEKVYFSGGSNIGGSSDPLEIGSGGFIPGFEYNMIGKQIADYSADNPMLVESFFPENYHAAELAGKTAYFEVYVEIKDGEYNIKEYDAPELNDAFITDTLKLSAETLSAYEGETLTDKYRSYMREQYLVENGLDLDTLILSAFWESVMTGAVVKKYPEKQLKETKDALKAQAESTYKGNYYYAYYYTLDEFICLYLGFDPSTDPNEALDTAAKEQIKQQLIFYHIMNVEGLKPSEEEYDRHFDGYLVDALESNGVTPDKYDTEEEYLAEKAKFKADILESKGDDYFKSVIYYQIGIEAITSYANVVEIGE